MSGTKNIGYIQKDTKDGVYRLRNRDDGGDVAAKTDTPLKWEPHPLYDLWFVFPPNTIKGKRGCKKEPVRKKVSADHDPTDYYEFTLCPDRKPEEEIPFDVYVMEDGVPKAVQRRPDAHPEITALIRGCLGQHGFPDDEIKQIRECVAEALMDPRPRIIVQ